MQGKLQIIETAKDGLPDFSTLTFVVDEGSKGMLGRMVCVYGAVNKQLKVATFPGADHQRTFEFAGKDHHTLVDAIWGCAQFLLGYKTRKVLIACMKAGLYEWLRMRFGPAPAPAHMQSCVAKEFGELSSSATNEPFCTVLMRDLTCSSVDFQTHVGDVSCLCTKAARTV